MDDAQIAVQVWAFFQSAAGGLAADLTQVEAAVLTQVRRSGTKVVGLHRGRQKLGYAGASRPCPRGRWDHGAPGRWRARSPVRHVLLG